MAKARNISSDLKDHPYIFFEDAFTAFLLSWIEKSGFTSESEIAEETGIDKQRLNKLILRLFKNRLIRLEGVTISVSTKGANTLEKMNVDSDIIDQTAENTNILPTDRTGLASLLKVAREQNYEKYKNSLGSLRVWSAISSSLVDPDISEEDKSKAEMIGHYCISIGLLAGMYSEISRTIVKEPAYSDFQFKREGNIMKKNLSDKNRKLVFQGISSKQHKPLESEIYDWMGGRESEARSSRISGIDKIRNVWVHFFDISSEPSNVVFRQNWLKREKDKLKTVSSYVSKLHSWAETGFNPRISIANQISQNENEIDVLRSLLNLRNILFVNRNVKDLASSIGTDEDILRELLLELRDRINMME